MALHNECLQLHVNGANVYRLLPKNALTNDGKRNVSSTIPSVSVKYAPDKSQHPDNLFARSTITNLEDLAAMLGPREVSFHCQNSSYRVPIGLALANTDQSPLLMHLEQKQNMCDEDEDYITPPVHKLLLSITAARDINENSFSNDSLSSAITNSGSTYIAIRTAEYEPHTAFQRLRDMKLIRQVRQMYVTDITIK